MKEKSLIKRIKVLEGRIKTLEKYIYKYQYPEKDVDLISGIVFKTKKPTIEEQIQLIMNHLHISFHHEVKDEWQTRRN